MGSRLAWIVLAGCGRLAFDPVDDPPSTETTFRDLCRFDQVVVIENGLSVDDQVGNSAAAALASGCGATPVTRRVAQDDPGILDPGTGRPLIAADELVVIGGGDGPNRAIAYLLAADTPLVWSDANNLATIRERATDRRIVADGPFSSSHDYAMVMVIEEPIGGGRVLSAQGLTANGTSAAGSWFATAIAPQVTSSTARWEVIEWTDTDGTPGVTAGDTLVLVDTGR